MLPDWMEHAVLAELAQGGAALLADDPMDLPFVSLQPGTILETGQPMVMLEPAGGGVIARRLGGDGAHGGAPLAGDMPGLAVDRSGRDAAAAGFARQFGRAPDVAIGPDGVSFAAGPGAGLAPAFEAALDRARSMEPLALLRIATGRLSAARGLGVTEEADAVIWFDPLVCLRGIPPDDARLAAMRATVELWTWRPVKFALPVLGAVAPRWRLEFADSIEARTLEVRGMVAASPRAVDRNVVEVAGDRPCPGAVAVTIRGHRARLVGVGLVVPMPVADEAVADPLARYADPLAGYSPGRAP